MSDTKCVFCRIILGELPSRFVLETADLVAFKDLNPQAPTHILIAPRKHVESVSAASDEDAALLGKIQLAARDIAKNEGLMGGWRLVTNTGRGAGQSVFHLHYHLLGGRRFMWPPG